MIINQELLSIIESHVGRFSIIEDYRGGSSRTGVIKISIGSDIAFVKIHNRPSRFHAEVHAYSHWTAAIEPYCPKMLHHFNEIGLFGIIISPIRGRTVNEYQMSNIEILKNVYFHAGDCLKRLQSSFEGTYFGIPLSNGISMEETPHADPVIYIASSIESIFQKGYDQGLFSDNDKELLDWCLKNSHVFSGCKPVPTHWDYSQNNWMIDETGNFTGIIDFENTLWGIDYDSFGVTVERYALDEPELLKALFAGYGMEQTEQNRVKLQICLAKMAFADVTYGHATNYDRAYACGKKLLGKLIGNSYL